MEFIQLVAGIFLAVTIFMPDPAGNPCPGMGDPVCRVRGGRGICGPDTAYPGSWTGYIERNVMKQLIENKVEELLSGQFCLSKACLRGNQTVFTVKADAKKPYLKILAYKNCVAVCSSEELSGRLRWLLQGKEQGRDI